MVRLFKHYISHAVLLMGLFDVGLLILAAELAFRLRAQQVGMDPGALTDRYLALGGVAATMLTAMVGVGVYGAQALRSLRFATARLLVADELPQAWSVLKGEMSFVGPRPERPEFVADLEEKLPFYAERHMVKPGITGWAQINYPCGASIEDSRQKLEFDLYYAKNYTPFLDLLILLQTLRVVLWHEGAR